MIYYEEVDFAGRWRPRTANTRPDAAKVNGVLRMRLNGGSGPRVRAITEIMPCMCHLTLDQKREVLSPDGRFYNKEQMARD